MDLAVFPGEELSIALRAIRAVSVRDGVFSDGERDFLIAVAHLHGQVVAPDDLAPITLEEVAQRVRGPHRRKRLVQLAMVAALIEGHPDQATTQGVADLARALGIEDAGLEVLRQVVDGDFLLARFDMARRLRKNVIGDMGFSEVLRLAIPVLGLSTDAALAARYLALERCAAGTFGRAFFDHYREHGFPFPGERKGVPERMTFHDAGHVLSGYGVDPAGEIQQAAFQAGFMRRDGFSVLLFGLLQFHLGLRITPVARGERGYFDVKKVMTAAQRGASCKVDLSDAWDLFSVVDVPLAALRESYGVPPLGEKSP